MWDHQVHIYCDESGGIDSTNHSFLVSAVSISPHDAARFVKAFRKITGRKGEIKGGRLEKSERELFFSALADGSDYQSVVVTCCNTKPLGKWAKKTFHERDIFAAMLAECCLEMPYECASSLNIISDGGRYPRNAMPSISGQVASCLSAERQWDAKISFADSRDHAGIQIADVIGNSVFQMLKSEPADFGNHDLCGPLVRSGRLIINATTINGKKPNWLE